MTFANSRDIFQLIKNMALIMKYIDSMHHYMDKYGGEYLAFIISKLQSKFIICVNCPRTITQR